MKKSFGDLYQEGIKRLKNLECPSLESRLLLQSAAGMTTEDFFICQNIPFSAEISNIFYEKIRRRLEGVPLAYLTGTKEFRSLEFKVGPGVLIPRPETELVVQTVLDSALQQPEPPTLLDIGTGSGNIALSLAIELPDSFITATDISPDVLKIARDNADRMGITLRFLLGDRFDPLADLRPKPSFDYIVSNPPYVALSEWSELDRGIREYEPKEALVAGEKGTEFIRDLITGAPEYLKPGGWLVFEIGFGQEYAVRELFDNRWCSIECSPDLAGIPRVFSARKK